LSGPSEAVFLGQIVALLVCGRLMGELMQRIGQHAVMGQLIAGVALGPSILGAAWPGLQESLFPARPDQEAMLGAVAQLGILLLLLLTGMETDLTVVRRSGKTAFSVSIAGVAVPFFFGVLLGELLPGAMLPDPQKRLLTTLFIGTALSVSSIKIVAMVVHEAGFLRRTVGQVIVAATLIDDAVGWIIVSIILGLVLHGAVDLGALLKSVVGTAVFLLLSFTIGRRIVSRLIRWANDSFVSELPVITVILVVTGVMALITNTIGVHTVLGAFLAGILVGQSPILTRHIDEQLRGLIVALFMPVFFGLAGLTTNVGALAHPNFLLLTIGLIAIASIGKFGGAFLGGRLGGMTWAEALQHERPGLDRGHLCVDRALDGRVLSQDLFTAIVTMAVVTTMLMPTMLRWALMGLPMRPDEAARLEREELEARGFVSRIERLLVAVDASPSGQFASRLAGLLAGARRIPTTVIHFDYEAGGSRAERDRQALRTKAMVAESVEAGEEADPTKPRTDTIDVATRVEKPTEEAIVAH
jgi:Kef-type K+ transport system membrane component KefB